MPSSTIAPSHSAKPVDKASLAVAALSTIVEWYDFTLYLYFASVLSRVFFGDTPQSLLVTLGGFAISYLMRPLGAAVFGHIGDKFGRKTMMMLSMLLITVAMFATALLPTAAQIGTAAGVALIALRCVMSFAVGAEYTGVVAYLLEGAKRERRGFITSLASAASEVGGLLAVAVCGATVAWLSEAQLTAWGWRIPFIIGGVLALVVWIARSTMQESPEFIQKQRAQALAKSPLLQTIREHKVGIFRSFMISALGSITYYVGISYVPIFLQDTGNHSEKLALSLSTIAAVAVIVITPLVGGLTDKVGRRPVLIGLALCCVLLPALLFGWMASGTTTQALIGAVLLACLAGGVSAVGASATAEQFTTEGRLSGLALGTTMATAIFGGLTPWLAQYWLDQSHWAMVPALMIAVVAVVVLPVFWQMPETAFDAQR